MGRKAENLNFVLSVLVAEYKIPNIRKFVSDHLDAHTVYKRPLIRFTLSIAIAQIQNT